MNEVINAAKSLGKYMEIDDKLMSMRENGHSDEDIAKELGMSLIDMRLFHKLVTK